MSLTAIILISISALMHAAWNLKAKSIYPSISFFFIANILGTFFLSPILIFFKDKIPYIPASIWFLLIITGAFQALYMGSLAMAYRSGDISIVYPIARSLPAVIIVAVSLLIGIRNSISLICISGILLIIAGSIVLPMKHFRDLKLKHYLNVCLLFSLFAAIGTAGYSIIDDSALYILRNLKDGSFTFLNSSLVYAVFEGLSCSLWLGMILLFIKKERKIIVNLIQNSKLNSAATGAGIYLTYTIVLISMAFAKNVSYIVGFRQLSIPLGAFFGYLFLKERIYMPKIVGIIVILSGLLLIALG